MPPAGRASALGAIEYELETEYAEAEDTYATHRLPVLGAIDVSALSQQRLPAEFLQQRLQEGSTGIKGPKSGTFTTRFYMPGHGGATDGAMAATPLETLLFSYVMGMIDVGPTGTTATGGGTAAAPATTAANGFTAGSLCRVGTGGLAPDGRGNGAWAAIATHAANALTLLTALDVAPNAADVIHSAVTGALVEDANNALATPKSIRMRIVTAGQQYTLHGCVATAYTFAGLNVGELRTIEVTWTCARWEKTASGTTPSTVTSTQRTPAPNAGGGLFVADVGVSTRDDTSKRRARGLQVEVTVGLAPIVGYDTVSPEQTIVGWARTPAQVVVRWQEVADDTATLTPFLDSLWDDDTHVHVLADLGRTAGKACAFYFPNCCAAGERPKIIADGDIWWSQIELHAYTTTVTTSQLTLSAMKVAFS